MEQRSPDRRRFPRYEATNGLIAIRPVSMAVQMLDLSSEGVLLACPQPQRLGAKLRVTAQISGRRLEADLDVRHASNQWDQHVKGYRVGGRFVALDPMARCVIDDLMGEARS
jgi:hypothetical protein